MNPQAFQILEFPSLRALVSRNAQTEAARKSIDRLEPVDDYLQLQKDLHRLAEMIEFRQRGNRISFDGVVDTSEATARLRIAGTALDPMAYAGEEARYFMLSAHDDAHGVMQNMGVGLQRRQQYFTTGMMVAVINSVVGGAAVAIAIGTIFGASLGISAGIGGVAAILSLVWMLRTENRMYHEMGGFESLFPSPPEAGGE